MQGMTAEQEERVCNHPADGNVDVPMFAVVLC